MVLLEKLPPRTGASYWSTVSACAITSTVICISPTPSAKSTDAVCPASTGMERFTSV